MCNILSLSEICMFCVVVLICFFKQKTAYEMRISDWSSDVCSSDLEAGEQARAFGPVRILFSNAGVGGGSGPFEQYDTDVWRWNYAVNAHAHLYACRTFLGDMKASGEASHLVITSSMVAIVPPPISVAYISSKYAPLGIAMALRNEI